MNKTQGQCRVPTKVTKPASCFVFHQQESVVHNLAKAFWRKQRNTYCHLCVTLEEGIADDLSFLNTTGYSLIARPCEIWTVDKSPSVTPPIPLLRIPISTTAISTSSYRLISHERWPTVYHIVRCIRDRRQVNIKAHPPAICCSSHFHFLTNRWMHHWISQEALPVTTLHTLPRRASLHSCRNVLPLRKQSLGGRRSHLLVNANLSATAEQRKLASTQTLHSRIATPTAFETNLPVENATSCSFTLQGEEISVSSPIAVIFTQITIIHAIFSTDFVFSLVSHNWHNLHAKRRRHFRNWVKRER